MATESPLPLQPSVEEEDITDQNCLFVAKYGLGDKRCHPAPSSLTHITIFLYFPPLSTYQPPSAYD